MLASLAGLEAAQDDAARQAVFRRIALLDALAIGAGGIATTYMRDETGMTNHYGYRDDPARRIGGDLARLRRARMASRGACVSTRVATDEPTLLAARCGADTVLFDFSGDPASLPAAGNDRLTGEAGAGLFDGWQVAWIAGDVR